MGRPDEGDATNYQQQAEIQADLYTPTSNDYPSYDQQQQQQQDAQANLYQQQQQQQQIPPPQQQPQYNQVNSNPNPQFIQPAYQAPPPPQAPVQFPPKSPQMNPVFSNQPATYPPQNPPQMGPPAAYPPPPQQGTQKTYPPPPQVTPTPFPPPQPTMQQPPAGGYTGMAQPVQFPPPATGAVEMQQQMPSASPMKPPPMTPPAQGIPLGPTPMPEGWRTGLFDFMDDPMNAIVTLFFPCLTFGQVAEIIDKGQTSCGTAGMLYFLISSFIGMPCIYSCTYRAKLRSHFGLMETPAPDWVVHFLCEPCALCQAYRELNMRGWDPALGWMCNVQKNQYQQPQQVMTPPTNQRMMG